MGGSVGVGTLRMGGRRERVRLQESRREVSLGMESCVFA